jgi:hypothetical protein
MKNSNVARRNEPLLSNTASPFPIGADRAGVVSEGQHSPPINLRADHPVFIRYGYSAPTRLVSNAAAHESLGHREGTFREALLSAWAIQRPDAELGDTGAAPWRADRRRAGSSCTNEAVRDSYRR